MKMSFRTLMLGASLATTLVMYSCKKQEPMGNNNNVAPTEENDNFRMTGAVAEKPGDLVGVRAIMSQDFVDQQAISIKTMTDKINQTFAAASKRNGGGGGADMTAPTVSITSPSNSTAVSGTVGISVSASDNVGVASVTVAVDGTTIGTMTAAPYNFSWNSTNALSGSHTITATARDAAYNAASSSVQVTINTTIIQPIITPSSYSITMPSVRNQGSEGSCVSFAAAYTRAAEQYFKTGATSYSDVSNMFSPEYIFDQTKAYSDCSGSSVSAALNLLKSKGVCSWNSMVYSSSNGCALVPTASQDQEAANYKIASYSVIANTDMTTIKSKISSNHPIIITVNIDNQFYNAGPGFIWSSSTGTVGAHALTICGYDDSKHAYKVINSWGTNWGDAGYTWIDYTFFTTVASYYVYVENL
jgi:hypothetical protein